MKAYSEGYTYVIELFREYVSELHRSGIATGSLCLINEHILASSIYANMPDFTQEIVDRLIDLADIDVEKFNQELNAAISTYRFFNVTKTGNNRFAEINLEVLCLRALQMNPQDDELLSGVYVMGRCIGLNGQGKRCGRRAVSGRLCDRHAPQDQPTPPPAAE